MKILKMVTTPAYAWRLSRAVLMGMALCALVGGCATAAKSREEASSGDPHAKAEEAIAAGDAAVRQGDHERALYDYVRALLVDERNETALLRIAALHMADGKNSAAEQTYRQLLAINDRNAGGWEGLGLLMLRTSHHEKAQECLRRAVELDATRWRAQDGLGVIADLQGHPDAAAQHYAVALAIRPDDPRLLNNLGYSKYLAHDWQAAESYFQAVLSRDPANKHALSNLALVAARRDQYDKALAALKQVGDEAQAYNNLGYICLLNGEYAAAERFLREAVRLSPTYNKTAQENLATLRTLRSPK